MRWRTLTISKKLVGLISALVLAVVVTLATYFPTRQIGQIERDLVKRADVYGALAARQLEPAVAFADRITARETLESLMIDSDVKSATLFHQDGSILHREGVAHGDLRTTAPTRQVFTHDGGVHVVAPIATKEGPTGTVVLELTHESAHAEQHRAALTAAVVGLGVLVLAIAIAVLIARSFSRRLKKLADAATSIATGDLCHKPIVDTDLDEIGAASRAFDAMADQLKRSVDDIHGLERQKREVIERANSELEQRIDERTAALVDANDSLRHEMAERARIEIELRQAQKLEAVGRLASGVAHELNTPIQFVADSCTFIDGAVRDLVAVAQQGRRVLTEARDGATTIEAAVEAFESEAQQRDVDYSFTEAPGAVARALDGLERMASIVRSMKEFSHPDQPADSFADVNRGLVATIEMARNEYKYVADVTTDLGELPPLLCRIGELNQVFLNLIVNAAHAVADAKLPGQRGTITIRTWVESGEVRIRIADTGTGIPADVRDKIFEPFFTTKPVGKGTGQGLAIARSIVVDKHAGAIEVESTVGSGTAFTLRLPVERSARTAA